MRLLTRRKTPIEELKDAAIEALVNALDDDDKRAAKPRTKGVRALAAGAVIYTAGRAAFKGQRFVREQLSSDTEDDQAERLEDEEETRAYEEPEGEEYEVDEEEDEPEAVEKDDEPEAVEDDEAYEEDDEPEASEEDETSPRRPRKTRTSPRQSRSPRRTRKTTTSPTRATAGRPATSRRIPRATRTRRSSRPGGSLTTSRAPRPPRRCPSASRCGERRVGRARSRASSYRSRGAREPGCPRTERVRPARAPASECPSRRRA